MKTSNPSATHSASSFVHSPAQVSSGSFGYPTVILGAGRLGTALALHLQERGVPLLALWNRTPPRQKHPDLPYRCGDYPRPEIQKAGVVLLTVSDDAIVLLARDLWQQQCLVSGQVVIHCSGRLDAQSLVFLEQAGYEVGRMHPLQPIASVVPGSAGLFAGVSVGVDGSVQATAVITDLVQWLGGEYFSLEGVNHALYHSAAVFASNYLVTLAHVAQQLMIRAGLKILPLPLLLPLMEQALHNVKNQGLPHALTGPISRTDRTALMQHVAALEKGSAEYLPLYLALAKATLPIAEQQHPHSSEHLEAIARIEQWLDETR